MPTSGGQGLDIPSMFDAAMAGFLAPCCSPDLLWISFLQGFRSIKCFGPTSFGLASTWGWLDSYGRTARICLQQMRLFGGIYLGGQLA